MHQVNTGDARLAILAIMLTWLVATVASLRLPEDVGAYGQGVHSAYVADMLGGGNWLQPRDHTGRPATKPPGSMIVGAVVAGVLPGELTVGKLRLPSRLAWLAMAISFLVVRGAGARPAVAGVIALMNFFAFRYAGMIRSDVLYMMLSWMAVLAVHRSLLGERRWPLVWMLGLLLLLTKGPWSCIPIGAATAMAVRRRRGEFDLGTLRQHAACGFTCLGALGLLFVLGTQDRTDATFTFVVREFLQHFSANKADGEWHPTLIAPGARLLLGVLPWCVAAAFGARRLASQSPQRAERLLDTLALGYLVGGLLLLGLSANHRTYYCMPLVPAAAWLLSAPITASLRGLSRGLGCLLMVVPLILTLAGFEYHTRTRVENSPQIVWTREIIATADASRALNRPTEAILLDRVPFAYWLLGGLGSDLGRSHATRSLPAGESASTVLVTSRPAKWRVESLEEGRTCSVLFLSESGGFGILELETAGVGARVD